METIKKDERINNILFVDNDRVLVSELKDWIKRAEIETNYKLHFTFVSNAKEALKKLSEMSIDTVILEITLPLINGYHLINAIKKHNETIPIAIYTSLKNPQDLAKMAGSKVNNIFLKELMGIQDLVEIIHRSEGSKNIDAIVMELNSQIKALHSQERQSELKLIQCPQCHLILAPDSHFCNNCGQKVIRKTKKILIETDEQKKETEKKEEKNSGKKKGKKKEEAAPQKSEMPSAKTETEDTNIKEPEKKETVQIK